MNLKLIVDDLGRNEKFIRFVCKLRNTEYNSGIEIQLCDSFSKDHAHMLNGHAGSNHKDYRLELLEIEDYAQKYKKTLTKVEKELLCF